MSTRDESPSANHFRISRRQLFGSGALASLGVLTASATEVSLAAPASAAVTASNVPFYGTHQSGITTAAQDHLAFATFDLAPNATASDLRRMLDEWTHASARMTQGQSSSSGGTGDQPPSDTGEALGLGPASLTVTLGIGQGFFNRAGIAANVPGIPPLPGDQLDAARSGGDFCIQACSDDPQVAFHAVHSLVRLGSGTVTVRDLQLGFGRTAATTNAQSTPRNLMGFKDGTNNIVASDQKALDEFVWLQGSEVPEFLRGGTYLVARRIRMRLESWTETSLENQQAAVGRFKGSGAPLTGSREHDVPNFVRTQSHGLPVIPMGAHIRVASPGANGGVRMLRRGYSYAEGIDPVTGELDAGLFFISFQKDPLTQFAAVQRRLAANDTMHRYLSHRSSAVFAIPRGLQRGETWGQMLLA